MDISAGFELMHRDLGNTIHFSIIMIQVFPPSQNIMIPKYNKVSHSKTEKQNLLSAAIKNKFQDFFTDAFQSYYALFQIS